VRAFGSPKLFRRIVRAPTLRSNQLVVRVA